MRYLMALIVALFCLGLQPTARAQDSRPVEQLPTDSSASPPADNTKNPPRSDVGPGESSSRQTQIDVAPPKDDAKNHPEANLSDDADEFTPYNPMKAMKDIEVGDFYFKRERYSAAESRYREALEFKPHDAEATFKLAEVQVKMGEPKEARENYEQYLKILPNGPYAKKAREALDKLKDKTAAK